MEWLQSLLDSGTTPAITAFLLGLLTAISPCPLATNIAAIGFIGKNIESRKVIFRNGLLYTLGRIVAYTLLGAVLIAVLEEGASLFGIQKFIARYGEMIIGPALLLIGLFLLFGDRLSLPSFGFKGNGERLVGHGGWGALLLGVLFALAVLPNKRSALFRHADTNVGNNNGRLLTACFVCNRDGITGSGCGMGTGFQCTTHR